MTAITDRLADALDRLGALAQQTPAPSSSVELSQTARGATQVQVKVYAADIETAAARAQELYDQLVAKYAAAVAP